MNETSSSIPEEKREVFPQSLIVPRAQKIDFIDDLRKTMKWFKKGNFYKNAGYNEITQFKKDGKIPEKWLCLLSSKDREMKLISKYFPELNVAEFVERFEIPEEKLCDPNAEPVPNKTNDANIEDDSVTQTGGSTDQNENESVSEADQISASKDNTSRKEMKPETPSTTTPSDLCHPLLKQRRGLSEAACSEIRTAIHTAIHTAASSNRGREVFFGFLVTRLAGYIFDYSEESGKFTISNENGTFEIFFKELPF